jgi:hypothetical protein
MIQDQREASRRATALRLGRSLKASLNPFVPRQSAFLIVPRTTPCWDLRKLKLKGTWIKRVHDAYRVDQRFILIATISNTTRRLVSGIYKKVTSGRLEPVCGISR